MAKDFKYVLPLQRPATRMNESEREMARNVAQDIVGHITRQHPKSAMLWLYIGELITSKGKELAEAQKHLSRKLEKLPGTPGRREG